MTRDTWIGIVFLAFSVLYWIAADGIRISPLDGPVTAAGLPKSLAYALAILAVLLIARSMAVKRLAAGASTKATPAKPAGDAIELSDVRAHLRAAGMLALGVGYLLVVPYLGYTLSILGLLFATALYAGARLGAKTALIAVVGAVFFYLFFVQLLNIPLPPGFWPDLLGPLLG
jgi:putative tricarboxylic transport membrane protein